MNTDEKRFKLDYFVIILVTLLSTCERIQLYGIPLYTIIFIPLMYIIIVGSIQRNSGRLLCDRFELSMMVWLVFGIALSIIHGLGGDYRGLEGLILDFLIIICIYSYNRKNFDMNLLIGLMGGFILNVVIGLMEIHKDGFHVVGNFSDDYLRLFYNKAAGFHVNVNDYCAMMVSYIIAVLYLRSKLQIKNRIANVMIFGSIAASVYIIVVDFSRAAIISLLVIAIYLLIYKLFGKRRWKMISIALLIVGGLTVFFTDIIETQLAVFLDSRSDTQRMQIYKGSWEFIKRHFFMGVGPGNTTRLMGINPHNFVLEILSDYGIIVAILFVIILVKLLNYKTEKDNGKGYYLIVLFGICFLLMGISVSSLLRNRIVWVLFAYFVKQIKEIDAGYRGDLFVRDNEQSNQNGMIEE